MNKITRPALNFSICKLISLRSECERGKVGCIITRDNRIISSGYNNPPKAEYIRCKNTCDTSKSCTRSIHAEINAITSAAKHGIPLKGAELWCHYSPCVNCAMAIVQSGISALHYIIHFRDETGLYILSKNNIKVHNYPEKITFSYVKE